MTARLARHQSYLVTNATLDLTLRERAIEKIRCAASPLYFSWNYVRVKPDKSDTYQPLHLWPKQQEVLDGLHRNKLVILLKARQLGQTTVVLAYALWVTLFHKNSTILLFSKGLKESKELIEKIRMAVLLLPKWLRPKLVTDAKDRIQFANGSRFISFASKGSGGDSYTARLAIVDEADLIDDLATLLGGVKPTISAAGQLVLLSRPDKSQPESMFKKLYRSAMAGTNGYWHLFLPWWSRPDRDQAFYDREAADSASPDWMAEQYPASVEEALAPRQESKRFPQRWLEACCPPLDERGNRQWPPVIANPAVLSGNPGLRVYREPVPGRQYVLGVDPASGKSRSKQANPNLDDSVAIVLDKLSMEQVAVLCNKIEPSLLGDYCAQLARYYNQAHVLVERNNHGHAVLSYLRNSCPDVTVLLGHDRDLGFLTTDKTKVQLYDKLAECARCGGFTINDQATYHQLASVESATLAAPEGQHDDLAMAMGFAIWAAEAPSIQPGLWVLDSAPDKTAPARGSQTEGVRWMEQWQCFVAEVDRDGRRHFLGEFETEEEARLAVKTARAQPSSRRPDFP